MDNLHSNDQATVCSAMKTAASLLSHDAWFRWRFEIRFLHARAEQTLGRTDAIALLEFQMVRRTSSEALFNSLMEQYHYLGYEQPVGEHLKYLVSSRGQAIACVAWCSAPRHLANRDRFIGWNMETRKRNLHLLAYNTRFLILPWVQVPHLPSHILGRMAKLVPQDWQQLYAHPVHWLETFIDPTRFQGRCYRAAN
jgi:hypothetical protein